MIAGGLRIVTPPTDPVQARYVAVAQMIRELKKELAHLKEQLLTGACEECGTPFKRHSVGKRYCSSQCIQRVSYRNRTDVRFDGDLLREMLPALEACGQLSARNLDIVRMVVVQGRRAAECADMANLTRERVGQILGRATSLAKLLKRVRASLGTTEIGSGNQGAIETADPTRRSARAEEGDH